MKSLHVILTARETLVQVTFDHVCKVGVTAEGVITLHHHDGRWAWSDEPFRFVDPAVHSVHVMAG